MSPRKRKERRDAQEYKSSRDKKNLKICKTSSLTRSKKLLLMTSFLKRKLTRLLERHQKCRKRTGI